MRQRQLNLGVVVLAAGAGSRFGGEAGGKLLAPLRGRAVLAHVLAAVDEFGSPQTVVVVGDGAERIEAGIDWSDQRRVRNPNPELGLASSLRIGLAELEQGDPLDGAFIVLGDQPWLRADVMRRLADAASNARPADRLFVVPRYEAEPGPRNPVLLLRPAWPQAIELKGDRGMGELIEANQDQVLEVSVAGEMPDVDTPADIERLEHPPHPSPGTA